MVRCSTCVYNDAGFCTGTCGKYKNRYIPDEHVDINCIGYLDLFIEATMAENMIEDEMLFEGLF